MDSMNHDHGGMDGMMVNPPSSMFNNNMNHHHDSHMVMMHMTFFWGKNAEILFSGWPGSRPGMYALALVSVFIVSLLVEWLSHCKLIKSGSRHVVAGLLQTTVHALRIGLAYLVMLAVMSFNGGVFLAAVAGHTLGFLLFGSRVFSKSPPPSKTSDLPPTNC
ncbi:hypothetical protein Dsin_020430 [Dipteronia sinensis]|uniref:Copper transport protein n=1 Tax=Dipteronia sinensis TaxID=43782 RepID=A0AAE0E4Y6_9ROSI|nr:hypothetical protein Dsin_020430 [Dipteronia sinensis]